MTIRRLVTAALAVAFAALVCASPVLAAPAKAPAGKVNLNSASVAELASVPGIGPKLAARIVEQRQKAGAFKQVEDILAVKGIGEKSFAKLQPHLSVGEAAKPPAGR
jgi:competence protein ComEA